MKSSSVGRIVFGASAVLFGVIALKWYDEYTWQGLSRIWSLPFGRIAGGALMVLQMAGGIGLQSRKTARVAAFVLGVVYGAFSLVCVLNIANAPKEYGRYPNFFEQLCLLSAAMSFYHAAAARSGLGVSAISFAVTQIVYFAPTIHSVPKWIPPNQRFWAILTTAAFALAGLALLFNRQAKLAARLMAAMVALFGVLVWIPLLVAHPEAHSNWSEFALTFLIAGASWTVAD